MKNISLSSSMRSNLLSLQNTSQLMDRTQLRLSTGLKVNSAIDNPSSYYTASSLNNRASDLDALLDDMGQAIQTLKATSEGIDSGLKMLTQASAVASQAASEGISQQAGGGTGVLAASSSTADYVAQGYTAISSTMSTAQIQALITSDAKLVLDGDITLTSSLNLNVDDVIIEGNGHKISFTSTTSGESLLKITGSRAKINNIELAYNNTGGGSAVWLDSSNAGADISNIKISTTGNQTYGIRATNKANLTLDNTQGISVSGTGSKNLVNGDPLLFDGKSNTQAMINQIGADALAATAANSFYVGSKTGDFGQGTWYLPSIGELMQVYGYDSSAMTNGYGTSGMTGTNKTLINNALTTLAGKGGEAEALSGYVWSSSGYSITNSWGLNLVNGFRNYNGKYNGNSVRSFQLVKNCFDPLSSSGAASGGAGGGDATPPKVGDIMYADKSYGSASDYDGSKTAVGVVTNVSADGADATIMNLKDLTFSSYGSTGNFNPDNPYGGAVKTSQQTTDAKYSEDITAIQNYKSTAFLAGIKAEANITVTNTKSDSSGGGSSPALEINYTEQYNSILNQFDMLINDSSYKSNNLLKSDNLTVNFNEDRTAKLNINGVNATTTGLGINKVSWSNLADINASLQELTSAINSLRTYSSYFGNNYAIVQNREDFTQNIINVLEEGADQLTLADMNEESANMLALQTRQQLAVNALSLSSQANQSVLKLF